MYLWCKFIACKFVVKPRLWIVHVKFSDHSAVSCKRTIPVWHNLKSVISQVNINIKYFWHVFLPIWPIYTMYYFLMYTWHKLSFLISKSLLKKENNSICHLFIFLGGFIRYFDLAQLLKQQHKIWLNHSSSSIFNHVDSKKILQDTNCIEKLSAKNYSTAS